MDGVASMKANRRGGELDRPPLQYAFGRRAVRALDDDHAWVSEEDRRLPRSVLIGDPLRLVDAEAEVPEVIRVEGTDDFQDFFSA